MVGMRTSMAMDSAPVCGPETGGCSRPTIQPGAHRDHSTAGPPASPRAGPGATRPGRLVAADPDLLLGHHTVDDAERPELLLVRVAGGDQDVVRARLAGVGDVGA